MLLFLRPRDEHSCFHCTHDSRGDQTLSICLNDYSNSYLFLWWHRPSWSTIVITIWAFERVPVSKAERPPNYLNTYLMTLASKVSAMASSVMAFSWSINSFCFWQNLRTFSSWSTQRTSESSQDSEEGQGRTTQVFDTTTTNGPPEGYHTTCSIAAQGTWFWATQNFEVHIKAPKIKDRRGNDFW